MVEEDQSNILMVCEECSESVYPNKGNFDVHVGNYVKLKFSDDHGNEYMWVKVKKANEEKFEGVLDNDPALVKYISCGDNVQFRKEDALEIIRQMATKMVILTREDRNVAVVVVIGLLTMIISTLEDTFYL